MRRQQREFALKLLYAFELNPQPIEHHFEQLRESEKNFTDFSKKLILKCIENNSYYESLIKGKLEHWEYHRVAIIDRILLKIALTEFLFFEDIPPKVTIDEIIEIAKKYSTEKSGKFINGLLDSILKLLKQSKKINKTGRGLVSN